MCVNVSVSPLTQMFMTISVIYFTAHPTVDLKLLNMLRHFDSIHLAFRFLTMVRLVQ